MLFHWVWRSTGLTVTKYGDRLADSPDSHSLSLEIAWLTVGAHTHEVWRSPGWQLWLTLIKYEDRLGNGCDSFRKSGDWIFWKSPLVVSSATPGKFWNTTSNNTFTPIPINYLLSPCNCSYSLTSATCQRLEMNWRTHNWWIQHTVRARMQPA